MTVAEYQQAQKDIAEIRGQIAQLRDVVAKGVPAMRGVYGLDQPEAQPPIAEPQQTPQMMSAHEQVGTPNINPFQDNFTPSTNVKSMQEIAGQIAPQIDQPLGERIARGAMNLPVGMAAMAEQATSDPAGFAKGTAEYADTWMKRLNPNLMSPEAMVARTKFGQQLATDPVGTGLDALGVAGTALGLPSLGGKIKGFKSIKEARAAIKDIGKPNVDVPEVVQEPIRSETPKLGEQLGDKLGETPKVEQPMSAAEVVGKAKPTTKRTTFEMTMYHGTDAENIGAFDVSDRQYGAGNKNPLGDNIGAFFTTKKESAQGFGKNVVSRKIQLDNPKVFSSYEDFKNFLRENTSPNDGLEWKVSEYQDAPGEYFSEGVNADGVIADSKNFSARTDAERYVESKTKNNTKQGGQQLLKDMGYDGVVIKNPFIDAKTKEVWAIAFDNKGIVDGAPTDIPAKPTTATEVVAKADVTKPQTPQTITEDLSQGRLGDKLGESPVNPSTETPNWRKIVDLEPDESIKSNMLRYIAEKSKSDVELADVLARLKGYSSEDSGIAWAVANNPNSSAKTFEMAASNKIMRSLTTDENIARLRTKRGFAPDAGATPAQSTTMAKEPWEMTQAEAVKVRLYQNGFDETDGKYARANNTDGKVGDATGWANRLKKEFAGGHKMIVEDALEAGKPVPPEVLADYPELAAKYGKPTTAEAVVKKAGGINSGNTAKALRDKADGMQKQIDAKRNSGVFNQIPTARRANIGAGITADAERLELAQLKLRALADAHESGSIPESLTGISDKGQVEILLRTYYPKAHIHKVHLEKLLDVTKGKRGASTARASLLSRGAESSGNGIYIQPSQFAALDELIAIAKKSGNGDAVKWIDISDNKRLLRAGIKNEAEWRQAKSDIESLGKPVNKIDAGQKKIAAEEMEMRLRKEPGFFVTPEPVVTKMLEAADIKPGDAILEPSAGLGNIADKLPKEQTKVIEYNSARNDLLKRKGYDVVGNDFLEHTDTYDKIIMNPPFERMQDVDHVQHAYKRLNPGGKIVAIMGESPFFRSDKKAVDFRNWLDELGGTSEKLPDGAFKQSGTGVATRMVVIEKPAPTELHAGVNPFKIIDDYMTKRKLVNPLGTPEHVLSGKGIVEPFRKAQEAIRNDTKLRGESLQETLKGIQRGSKEDTDLYHRLDDPKAILNEQEQAVRNYLDDMLTEVNKHREARGQEPVKRRKGYITHLVEEVEKQSREYGDTPMPKRFRFQFELAREGNASHKVSAIEALEVYTKAALKDIYIGDALAETVPKIEAMGDRPLIFKKSVTSPDGKVTNMSFYQFSDAPIVTERGYAESFIKGQMNVPTVGQRILDKVFDIKPNTSSHAAMAVTARFYQSLLGLAVDSSVKNLTQGINTMAEMGVLPTLKGYAKLATAKGLKTAKAEHLLEDFNPLLMEGADLPFKTKTARTIGKGFSATMNAPMKVAEFINRGAAYHAAYDVYIKKGMSLEQAHEAARAAVRKTQFSYAKIDTSPALRGPFARTFSQFFSYPLKQSEMMYKWATKPGEQGKLVRYFLYTGMAVVGAKYGGVDLSGVFFDPIRMVDPNSKEGFQLPGTDKRVKIDPSKLGKSGYTPQGFAPSISIPYDFVKSQMSDDESAREYGREKALTNIIPGGRYGKKVYDVITESDEKGKRDRLTRENTTKDKVLKLLGGRSTDREAESSRRELASEVEKKYYATRQKLIDLKISGNEDEFIRLRDEFRDRYPFLYGRLMKGFGDAVKEERKKKGMTTDERFFDNSLRKQIDANL